jgi:hypothetical protein
MGGLVARYYMQSPDANNVYRLITVNTPHYGSPIVNIAYDMGDKVISSIRISSMRTFMERFLTDGARDLACPFPVCYQCPLITLFTFDTRYLNDIWTEPSNTFLDKLNGDLCEFDSRLVCYGSARGPNDKPNGSVHSAAATIMSWVKSPDFQAEGFLGYYSDCVVPWTSQFIDWRDVEVSRYCTCESHMDALNNPCTLVNLIVDLKMFRNDIVTPVAKVNILTSQCSVNKPVGFISSGSYDPMGGRINWYEWDWDNDGIFDQTTIFPFISHLWTAPGTFEVQMRVITDHDTSAILAQPLTVSIME